MLSRRCQLKMFSWTWLLVALVWTDDSEKVSSPPSRFLEFGRFHSFITLEISNLRNTEDGDDTFSETSVQASAARYQVQQDTFNCVSNSQEIYCSPTVETKPGSWTQFIYSVFHIIGEIYPAFHSLFRLVWKGQGLNVISVKVIFFRHPSHRLSLQ
jgi:hypothetical protein